MKLVKIKKFEHFGYECFIGFMKMSPSQIPPMFPINEWLNGYVSVKEKSPLYKKIYHKEYEELGGQRIDALLEVHGGITYSGLIKGLGDRWLLGFDCCHLYDLGKDGKDEGFVREELKALAGQIRGLDLKYRTEGKAQV